MRDNREKTSDTDKDYEALLFDTVNGAPIVIDSEPTKPKFSTQYYSCEAVCGVATARNCKNVSCSEHPKYTGNVGKRSKRRSKPVHKNTPATANDHQQQRHQKTSGDHKAQPQQQYKNHQQKPSQKTGDTRRRTEHQANAHQNNPVQKTRTFQNRYPRRSES